MVPVLSTPRLILAGIEPQDQAFIYEGLSHPDVIPFYGVRYQSFEEAKAQMDWYETMVAEGSGTPWKIVDRSTGESLGVICIYYYKREHNKAEIGFWLLPQFWNRGFAREGIQAATGYWKNEKRLHRLEAFVEEGNEASSRVLKNSGFNYEGTMKDCEIKDGKYISLRVYAQILQQA